MQDEGLRHAPWPGRCAGAGSRAGRGATRRRGRSRGPSRRWRPPPARRPGPGPRPRSRSSTSGRRHEGGCPPLVGRSWRCARASPAWVEGRSQAGHEEALDARRREPRPAPRPRRRRRPQPAGGRASRRAAGAAPCPIGHQADRAAASAVSTSSRGKSGATAPMRPPGGSAAPGGQLGERGAAVPVGAVVEADAELRRGLAAASGMKGAAANEMTRHASRRSPRTSARRDRGGLVAALRGLRQDPRLLGVHVSIGLADEAPEHLEGLVQETGLEPVPVARERVGPALGQRPPRGGGPDAVEVAAGHRQRPVHEVAEVVGQVGVVATHEAGPGDVAVPVEGDLAKHRVAGPVPAERGDHVDRVEEVAAALAHPLALCEEPAVHPDLARQRQAGAHEHGRPVDGVEAVDVLADDVEVGRPPVLEGRRDRPGSRRR